MTSRETKKFFLDVLDDLRLKCNSKSNYNYVKAAGLLRQLLLDEIPLIALINKDYKEKLVFEVVKSYPSGPLNSLGSDGLVYETLIEVRFVNPSASQNTDKLNRDEFLKHVIFTYLGQDVTVKDILKLNANKKGGVHLDNRPKQSMEEVNVEFANSTVNYTGDITGGAHAVHDIGKITLKALEKLEGRVKADLGMTS